MPDLETAGAFRARLLVSRLDDTWQARWVEDTGSPSEPFPLALPLSADDFATLRWYLETYIEFPGAGDYVRAAQVERRIEHWGRELFAALFQHPEGARVYEDLMAAARARRPAILTVGTNEPDVQVQPWEMVRDQRGPLLFQGVRIRRQLTAAKPIPRPGLTRPLRVLMIVSRPRKARFIDPRVSTTPMFEALEVLPEGLVSVDFCEPPTFERFEEMISAARRSRQPFHIVHYDGHGTYLPKTGVGALAFERDESGEEVDLVEARRLGDLLARLEVPLVILEACRSSALSEHPIFGSVAPALLQSGASSVIAFTHSVHIEAARLLVGRFYQALVEGLPVGQALEEARARLRAQTKRWLSLGPDAKTVDLVDWFIPQLYQLGADPVLVAEEGDRAPRAAPAARRWTENLHGFPPPPKLGFQGRARELLELERAFRRNPAVALTGMGGMGKTALAREAASWWLKTGRYKAAVFHRFEHQAGVDRVIQGLGQALLGDEFTPLTSQDQWSAAVDLFHQHKVLFVWDNFELTLAQFQEADEVQRLDPQENQRLHDLYRDLVQGEPAGRLLVTCRPQDTGLARIKAAPLSGLARPDSLHLLSAALQQEGISIDRDGYDREAIDELLKTIDDHPLSISLVAPHLKALTPALIQAELRQGLERFKGTSAEEERNLSLQASLSYSIRRLSPEARAMLPFLAWFQGGALENHLRDFTQLDADAWTRIRDELVATALIHVEEVGFSTPFIRFHPTLAFSERPYGESGDSREDTEKRFLALYLSLRHAVDQALHGQQPAAGMALLSLEESNFSSAMQRAFRRGDRQEGVWLSDTLGKYLLRAGRVRERDSLVEWLRSQLPEDARLDEAACGTIQDHAQGLLSQSRVREAVQTIQGLIRRLESEGLAENEDPQLQIATSYGHLGQIYVVARRPDLALEASRQAITLLEKMSGDLAQGNLAVALGDLANACLILGRFDEALSAAEKALEIERALEREREIGIALGRVAHILKHQQRLAEAGDAYDEVLNRGKSAGDLRLQAVALQHQASLQLGAGSLELGLDMHEVFTFSHSAGVVTRDTGRLELASDPGRAIVLGKQALRFFQENGNVEGEMQVCNLLGTSEQRLGQLDAAEAWYQRSPELAEAMDNRSAKLASDPGRAIVLGKQALRFFQENGNVEGEMQVCNLLGTSEQRLGQLDAAEAWYQRSRELAEAMDNRAALAVVFQNLGVLHQTRAERASNPQDSNDSLLRAVSTIEESLAIKLENKHQVGAAASYFQLGVLQRMLEDPTRAEDYFRRSLEISESLSLPDTYKIYHNLAEVVELRGDSQAQSEWFAKYKAAAAEIQRRHRGDGQPASVPAQLTNSILALARVVYDVRSRGVSLPADVSEALAKLSSLPAPLGEVGPFLRQVADGESPPVPSDLPKEVTKILEALLQAVG